jgi:hypothetical protein
MNEQEKNREAYAAAREKLEAEHPAGSVALLHDGEIVQVCDNGDEAYSIGREKYGMGHFSTQTIGEAPISLGVFSVLLSPAAG